MTTVKEMLAAIEERNAMIIAERKQKAQEFCDTVIEEQIQKAISNGVDIVRLEGVPVDLCHDIYNIVKEAGYYPDINYTAGIVVLYTCP